METYDKNNWWLDWLWTMDCWQSITDDRDPETILLLEESLEFIKSRVLFASILQTSITQNGVVPKSVNFLNLI